MSREKQIEKQAVEEMAKDICQSDYCNTECHSRCRYGENSFCWDVEILAEKLYNAGYRKQSEGEWIFINQATSYLEPPFGDTFKCSLCEFVIDVSEGNYKYCPNCGAKIKGGAE